MALLNRWSIAFVATMALMAGCTSGDSQLSSDEREALSAQCAREGIPADLCACISSELEERYVGAERERLVEQMAAEAGPIPSEAVSIVENCTERLGYDLPTSPLSPAPSDVDLVGECVAAVRPMVRALPDIVGTERQAQEAWAAAVERLDQSDPSTQLQRLDIEDAALDVRETADLLASLPSSICGLANNPALVPVCVQSVIEESDLAREWERARLMSDMPDGQVLAPEVAPAIGVVNALTYYTSVRQADASLLSLLAICTGPT